MIICLIICNYNLFFYKMKKGDRSASKRVLQRPQIRIQLPMPRLRREPSSRSMPLLIKPAETRQRTQGAIPPMSQVLSHHIDQRNACHHANRRRIDARPPLTILTTRFGPPQDQLQIRRSILVLRARSNRERYKTLHSGRGHPKRGL